jgi:aminoglycoside phosphotransferase (APT) family kinase protein
MDRQDLRALYAEQHGLGWALLDESELEAKAAMLLGAKARARVRRRASELTTGDGARQAALFIEETLIAAR